MDGYHEVFVFFGTGFIAKGFDTKLCPNVLAFFGGGFVAKGFCTECDRNWQRPDRWLKWPKTEWHENALTPNSSK